MNILFVVAYVPNLVRVRSFNMIRFLSERGHRVSVLTLYSSEVEHEDAKRLATFCHEVHALPLTLIRSLWNSVLALPSTYSSTGSIQLATSVGKEVTRTTYKRRHWPYAV
jgi:hypothetical protein